MERSQVDSPRQTGVTLTPIAARKVTELLRQQATPDHGLRVGVRGGGCSGHTYFIEFCARPEQDDDVFDSHGVRLVVDRHSRPLLDGTEIDFVDGLTGAGFKFNNPNASRSCSCGDSFGA